MTQQRTPERFYPARESTYTGIQWMLMNPAYSGKKEINKGNRDRRFRVRAEEIRATAHGLINLWATLATEDGASFLEEKLDDLGKRRGQIRENLASLETAMSEVERDTIDQELVVRALANFSDVYAELKPYQQKDLLRLVLHMAILGPDYAKIALYGRPPEIEPLAEGDSRFKTFKWLPGP